MTPQNLTARILWILFPFFLMACPRPSGDEVGEAGEITTDFTPATTKENPPTSSVETTNESPTTGSSEDTGSTGDVNSTEVNTTSSGGASSSDSDGDTGPEELCHDKGPVMCDDLAGSCPDGPKGPLTNQQLLGYFGQAFIDQGLIPCFKGDVNSPKEIGDYLQVLQYDALNLQEDAKYCLLEALNQKFSQLQQNPTQIAIDLSNSQDLVFPPGQEQDVLTYDFCEADAFHKIKAVTLVNVVHLEDQDVQQQPLALESLRVSCSVGSLENVQTMPFVQLMDGSVQALTKGCYIGDGSMGKLHVTYKSSEMSGTIRIHLVAAEVAMVLGSTQITTVTIN